MLRSDRAPALLATIRNNLAAASPQSVIHAVRACGFDQDLYLRSSGDLIESGYTPKEALLHFLAFGTRERRPAPFGPLLDGLKTLRALPIANHDDAHALFRSVYEGQLRNQTTVDRLWQGISADLLGTLRELAGRPYIVLGDSHANHYVRLGWSGGRWLGPLALPCLGASAMGLADDASGAGYGPRLLHWAKSTATQGGDDAPIFLKFGGIDAEFLWMLRRLRNRAHDARVEDFEEFADQSVARYASFIDRFASLVDPGQLRICSVFPAALADDRWVAHFSALHRDTLTADSGMVRTLQRLVIPDLRQRTRLRALYNARLRRMCESRRLVYVDDFSPLLDADEVLDERFKPGQHEQAHHVDYFATEEPLTQVIIGHL